MPQAKEVRCVSCGCLFGIQTSDGRLNIKHRDVYREIRGGIVSGPCRRCGTVVRWPVDTIEKAARDE